LTSTQAHEFTLFYVLLELCIIVLAGRLGGMLAKRFGQAAQIGIFAIFGGFMMGVIMPKMFTMLVIMAIVSTIITTPALRYYMPRAGLKLQA
jgi:hypothetical protein